MRRASFSGLCAILLLGACGEGSQQPNGAEEPGANQQSADEAAVQQNALTPDDLPPTIVRSPAYRCSDGSSLYVDVLSDDDAVLVRDSRGDVPTRLERSSPGGSFSGEERTLSGTGGTVSYSAPDRPGQTCTQAAE